MVHLTQLPSESSSSLSTHHHRFDFFISFRGFDTRNGFTAHLYRTLVEAGYHTFLDDEEIETGQPLKSELEDAIRSSRASVVVMSPNYASSTWCLEELVLILEQRRCSKYHVVIPVFYNVEPTDVRKQQNSFGEAMEKHRKKMEAETDAEKRRQLAQKMESWRTALTEFAGLKGIHANGWTETELIDEIVKDIYGRIGLPSVTTLPQLIGMKDHIKRITLRLKECCVNIITVWGMSGIGKTSLADYVYKLHCHECRGAFVRDINRRCAEGYRGLLDVQKQLHDAISKRSSIQVHDSSAYTSKIEKALTEKKVLLVLDDVNSPEQLDALLGNKGLHPGSKIIITTNDASITERCALFHSPVPPQHMKVLLNGLDSYGSRELLCIHAFKGQKPKEGYEDATEKLVEYCEGHPLALKVLGRSLHMRDLAYWEDCIRGLKKGPHSHIQESLQISLNSLPFKNDKDLFKHIACFFVGTDRDATETILAACDIHTRSGITNLIDRCLLSISWDNKLMMHQLIQEMGRDLVRQESPDKPWKRSRLWCHEESFKVLKQKKGKGSLLGLALDMRMLDKKKLCGSFELETDSLHLMENLMLLQLNFVQINGFFEDLPEELRWLCMHGFPLNSISLDLPLENLVALDMSYSNIESFDMSSSDPQPYAKRHKMSIGSSSKDNKRLLESLKILDLSFCEKLCSLGGFGELPSLERLIVKGCTSLIEVCESVEKCDELVYVDMSYCYKLNNLPVFLSKLKKVKELMLDGCNPAKLQSSDVSINSQPSSSAIVEAIPSDLKFFTIFLPSSLRRLSLAKNKLSNKSFPLDLSSLSMLEELCLDENPIVSMPDCVRSLPRLEKLSMHKCLNLRSIAHPPRTLRELSVLSTKLYTKSPLRKIRFDSEMSSLRFHIDHEPEVNSLTEITWMVKIQDSLFQIDGMVKIQVSADVEEKLLRILGWTGLELTKKESLHVNRDCIGYSWTETKIYYEFGIFMTFYKGTEMPVWISHRSKGVSISFTIPSSPYKLRGLNFCYVLKTEVSLLYLRMIKISNITKNQTWIYRRFTFFDFKDENACLVCLSHWMFGPNEMKAGDRITITLQSNSKFYIEDTECGVGLVYGDEDGKRKEEEDVLGYYKSWNHIIGGDLSGFELTTGEYLLDNKQFIRNTSVFFPIDFHVADDNVKYKEERVNFKAFSRKWSEKVDDDDYDEQ